MIAHFEMQQQRHNETAATSETKPDKMLFFFSFHKWLLVLFTPTKKKGHHFQLMKQGIESGVLGNMD